MSKHNPSPIGTEPAPEGTEHAVVELDRLAPGTCASVVRVNADDADTVRLLEMGVCQGRRVELVRAGDPLILRVLGTRLGVSARLAQRVLVRPCPAAEVCHDGRGEGPAGGSRSA